MDTSIWQTIPIVLSKDERSAYINIEDYSKITAYARNRVIAEGVVEVYGDGEFDEYDNFQSEFVKTLYLSKLSQSGGTLCIGKYIRVIACNCDIDILLYLKA